MMSCLIDLIWINLVKRPLSERYLKDGEQTLVEVVEVVTRHGHRVVEAELAAEQLHTEQSEDDDEESQQDK